MAECLVSNSKNFSNLYYLIRGYKLLKGSKPIKKICRLKILKEEESIGENGI